MIILQKISLINFLSHKKTEIKFEDNQKLLISGISGSGKSSIIDALIWNLYNKSRSDSRSLIHRGMKSSKVEVLLKDDESSIIYKIIRSITIKNIHKLEVLVSSDNKIFKPVEAIGLRGIQEYIEKKILKASYILFINSIVCLQDNNEVFTAQSASKKKDLLLEIINSNNYDEYLKKCKQVLQENSLKLESTTTKKEEKENQIIQDQKKSFNIKTYQQEKITIEKNFSNINLNYDKLIKKQQELLSKISFLEGKETVLNDIIIRINANNVKITKINNNILELKNIDIKQLQVDVEELKKLKIKLKKENQYREEIFVWREKFQEITSKKPLEYNYEIDIQNINQELIKVMQEDIPVCHKCGTKYLQFEENQQSRIKALESKLETINVNKIDYDKKLEEYNIALTALGDKPNYEITNKNRIESRIITLENSEKKLVGLSAQEMRIAQFKLNIITIQTEQKELEEKQAVIKNEIKDKEQLEKELMIIKVNIEDLLAQKQILENQKTENNNLLLFAEEAVKNIEKNKQEILKLKEDIISIKKNIESLKLIKEAFGVNGIKSTVIDYMIPEIEERINNILSKLSDFTISLDTQRSGIGKDTTLDGLFITITNEVGESMDFNSFSGGEKIKISYAVNEALASLSKCNFRIMDESVTALDEESLSKFIEIVEILQSNVKNVVCISHIQSIKDLFSEQITIIKKNGVSEIINN